MSGPQVAPHVFVIFGGTGDLTARKLLPAVYHLGQAGELPDRHAIIGIGRGDLSDDEFREQAGQALEESGLSREEVGAWCKRCLFYQRAQAQTNEEIEDLKARIEQVEADLDLPGNRVFYLALPPSVFPKVLGSLGEVGLNRSPGWTRLVVEKPFGDSLESARELNGMLHEHFDESQVYRIDHYLGKETVQNLLVFRFANSIFESLWNRDRVQSVQITVAESLGVESRAGYYDKAGALRDMVQNHLTQLVSLIGMEIPSTFDADAVRHEKIKLLKAIDSVEAEDVVFGQYTRGVIDDAEVEGYKDAEDVDPGSLTETFVAMKLKLDTWRWQGVPFYIRTGKRLPRRLTQIAVTFRQPPVWLFETAGVPETHPNVLILTLQPDEGFNLCIDVKVPGEPFQLRTLPLHFIYSEAFGSLPDAYQTLLLDILTGDQTLFVHAEEAEQSWSLYQPILEQRIPIHPYSAGSWGPQAANELLRKDGHSWVKPVDPSLQHDAAPSLP